MTSEEVTGVCLNLKRMTSISPAVFFCPRSPTTWDRTSGTPEPHV